MKKLFCSNIFISAFILVGLFFNLLSIELNARKVTLTKTGGNGLLDIAGIYIAPNYSQTTITNIIDWDENNSALGNVSNWTAIFNTVQNIVMNDSTENILTNVSYKIEIDAPDSTNPMIIGKQSFNSGGDFAKGSQIMQFGENDSTYYMFNPINEIKISGGNNKAYLKYKDSLYYGSWLVPSLNFSYYRFYYDHDNDTSTPYKRFKSTTIHNDYWKHNRIQNYPTGVDTIPFTNPSSTDTISLTQVTDTTTAVWYHFYHYGMRSTVGYFITAINCNHILIENLVIDGNSTHSKLGGHWGDADIQSAYSGIYLFHVKNGHINNVNAHHFGLDGFQIGGRRTDSITLLNCKGIYNGRQGVSWIGGNHVSFNNCNFSHTGRAQNLSTNKYLASSPAAGVDQEPENHDSLFNGLFVDCVMEDNTGSAVVNDFSNVYNMNFKRCTFHDTDNYGLFIKGYNFTFDSCHIYCSLIHGYRGNSLNGEAKFLNCDFEDKPYQGLPWTHKLRLITYDDVKKTLFKNCTFTLNDSLREFCWINVANSHAKSDWSIMDNCTFIYNNLGKIQDGSKSYLRNVKFRNKNKMINIFNGACSFKGMITENIELEGSLIPCDPSELIFEGQINHSLGGADTFNIGRTILGTDGYALYKSENKTLTGCDSTVIINITSKSSFEIGKNGSLYGGVFLPNGRFVIHDSSYYNLLNGSFVSTISSNSFMYIDNGCNPNMQSTASYWLTNSCITTGIPTYSAAWGGNQIVAPLCVHGGNNYFALNGSNLCNPNYNVVSNSGPLSINYNTTNVSCNGGSDGSATVLPAGGTVPYTYAWNPIGGTNASATNLTAGTYVVAVKDAYDCTISTSVNIATDWVNYCCNPKYSSAPVPKEHLEGQPNYLISTLGLSNFNGYTFFVHNNLVIDQSTTFTNCTFLFTADAKIILNPNSILTLNGCTLKAGCGEMWDGIYADDLTEQLVINGGTIQDMENGINVSNNAKIASTGATYQDNYIGLQLKNNTISTTCIVEQNTFKKNAVLLPPYASEVKPRYGIRIIQCNNLSIGSTSILAGENVFKELWTGIFIEAKPKSILGSATYLELDNNRFENIEGNTWGNVMNTDTRGWAVYAVENSAKLSMLTLKVFSDPSSASIHFNNCDKGILLRGVSGDVSYQKMNKTIVGINMIQCTGRSYRILSNSIQNTELGIAKNGDENASGLTAVGNNISLINPLNVSQLNIDAPTGIMSYYSSLTNIGTSNINNNVITIPLPDIGIGISISNGTKDFITNNAIHLTATTGIAATTIPELIGIYSNVSESLTMTSNVIDNNFAITGNTTFVPGNNAGIYIRSNNNSLLQCNLLNYLKYSAFCAGNSGSATDYTRTIGNTFRGSEADLLFYELGTAGSLGQIGKIISPINAYDANNTFLSPVQFKVYRNNFGTCLPIGFVEGIVTTSAKLTQSESGATTNPSSCSYSVINPPFFTNTFVNCGGVIGITNGDGTDSTLADLIANDQVDYEEDFEEGAKLAYKEMLYRWLDADINLRTSHPLLDSFYLLNHADMIGILSSIDKKISSLSDSTILSDSIAWNTLLINAKNQNNSISGQEIFEANAKYINTQYLNLIENGIESINENEFESIEQLANTCPYIGGNAVFKARHIMEMLNSGIHYDDIVICNSQGVYKNGISKLQEQLNMMNLNLKKDLIHQNDIAIYPNPTSSMFEISYSINESETLTFVLYDMFGNIVKTARLNGNVMKKEIDICELSQGVYTYKCFGNNNVNYYGKIIKE